ncbi:50S ribosomal protein L32e [Candidatus Woesearchaeota archaeon]|nr:50S ribosomal protein L32e [Candidatus Woesearchaeota archaeon]
MTAKTTAKSIAELLETRRRIKAKKPDFLIQDYHKRKELPRKWRKPRGLHSKMRMRKKGHPKQAEIGYGSPKQTRHLDRKGMRRVPVSSAKNLDAIDKIAEAAVIRHGVGLKKRLEILKAAEQKGITVANTSHAKIMKKIEDKLKKEAKRKAAPKQESEPKKAAEKAEAKEKQGEELKEEELKDAEKREKDKLLTKRETR